MEKEETINYKRVAEAIEYIRQNFKEQPELDEVAAKIHLSPFHFQRMFTDWAGVSPKKFLQFLSVEYSKGLLREKTSTLFDVADQAGLSGTGRLHDLFVTFEGMTPGEYKNLGEGLQINYRYEDTLFGRVLIASTKKGICCLVFEDGKENKLKELKIVFENATFRERGDALQDKALSIFSKDWNKPTDIKLHLKGSDFQLKVWQALLNIPFGQLTSYGKIAEQIGNPKSSRAVGTAIGENPIAVVIPCHRVVQSNGNYGEYRWGSTRKNLLIGWEAASVHSSMEI